MAARPPRHPCALAPLTTCAHRSSLVAIALAVAIAVALPPPTSASPPHNNNIGSFPAIFVFGDSLSDVGNGFLSGSSFAQRTSQLPYGETFPGWPTGRYSDGHVLVDLLATYLDLPLLSPYLNSSADFSGGVNYAVGGATALNVSFLSSLDVIPLTNFSLGVQLSWHLDLLSKVQASPGQVAGSLVESSFSEGLYVVEIGGNDYKKCYSANMSVPVVVSSILPRVIRQIHDTVETLLSTGAKSFLFMSTTPLGCSPSILSGEDGSKDSYGCLEEYNYACYLHGLRLQEEVQRLRSSYPHASFLYLDTFGAYMHVLKYRDLFGFSEPLKACCGAGDSFTYNFNPQDWCNSNSAILCDNPSEYIFWDGIHHTDSFYRQIFNQTVVTGSYLDFHRRSIA